MSLDLGRPGQTRRVAYLISAGLVVATIGIVATAKPARIGPGPLATAHSMLDDKCDACHVLPFAPAHALTGVDTDRTVNAACLDCHGDRINHERSTLESYHGAERKRVEDTACADCHVEHRGRGRLKPSGETRCVRCHADAEPAITTFAAGGHPDFAPKAGSDPIALHFDHAKHLELEQSTCSDCHVSRSVDDPDRRGAYMTVVDYEAACKSCHPLDVAHGPESVPYAGKKCATCHPANDDGPIAPVNATTRWFPGARFDHARHTALTYLSPVPRRDGECRICHASVPTSTRSADVSIPGAEVCQKCHGQAGNDRCSTCHLFHEVGRTPVSSYAEAGPGVVAKGLKETRFGMYTADPFWSRTAFDDLPAKIWKRPELKPGMPEYDAEMFKRYGLFPANYENDGLPLGLLKSRSAFPGDHGGIHLTCELCHSSMVFGELVIGQPNPFSNMEQLFRDLNQLDDVPLRDPLYDRNPYKNTIVNGADQLGLAGLAIRQPDLSLNVTEGGRIMLRAAMDLKPEFDLLAYIKTPPWYTFRTKLEGKASYYWDGGHPKDGNFSAFTYLPGFFQFDGTDVRNALAEWMDGGHAFLASLEAPKYPFPVDEARAKRGREIYDETCSECHGVYEGAATPANLVYPGRVVAIEEVDTDPKRAHFPAEFAIRMKKILKDQYVARRGYVAVPLDGIWARAPYLHNGAVPTLRMMFRPDTRPRIWALTADPNNKSDYLQDDVGWKFEALEARDESYDRIFDPDITDGLGNGGHRYGSDLDDEDLEALLAFLKTL